VNRAARQSSANVANIAEHVFRCVHLAQAKQQEAAEAAAAAAGKDAAAASSEAPAADAAAADADSSKEAAAEQPKELQVKKEEDAVESVKKMIAAQRGEFGEEERKGQKEITLTDELEGPVK
jgi:hypothetical protein